MPVFKNRYFYLLLSDLANAFLRGVGSTGKCELLALSPMSTERRSFMRDQVLIFPSAFSQIILKGNVNAIFAVLFYVSNAISSPVLAQSNEIKKLQQQLVEHINPDTIRVNRLLALSNAYPLDQKIEIEKNSSEAVELSQKLSYVAGEVKARILLARVASSRNAAITMLKIADSIALKSGDRELQFWVTFQLALSYAEKDNRQALHLAFKAESLAQSIGSAKLLSIAQLRAAETYTNLSNYPLAMEYSLKSQKNAEASKYTVYEVKSWGRIAHIYTLIGNYEMAMLYYQKQADAYRQQGASNRLMASLQNNIGEAYHRLARKYPEALQHYKYAMELDSNYIRSITEINLADVYERIDSLRLAFKLRFFQSLREAKKEDDLSTGILDLPHIVKRIP